MTFEKQIGVTMIAGCGLIFFAGLLFLAEKMLGQAISVAQKDLLAKTYPMCGFTGIFLYFAAAARSWNRFWYFHDPEWPRIVSQSDPIGRWWFWVNEEGRDRDA